MFHTIPPAIAARMAQLEAIDRIDRSDGTARMQRLRQVSPQVGRFLALLAAGAPPGAWLEIGASAGYSALWLALACRASGRTLTTFEVLEAKATLARETFRLSEVEHVVNLVVGDARAQLPVHREIAFCFLDAEKEVYADCYDLVTPQLVVGGLLVADNVISHREALQPVIDRALHDTRVDALVVPLGQGLLVCRKV